MILKHDQTLADLRSINAANGQLSWIGIRPEHRQAMISQKKAILLENKGIEGDHIAKNSSRKRQVTLIQEEHLAVVQALVKQDTLYPEFLRRNLVVGGINLLALKGEQFSIRECVLEGTGLCHPCSRMEEALGKGGYNAMRGHGGITAVVIHGGLITLGDSVSLLAK
tara:strand:+ start:508 stop:1008 length:501 start_codon:yes stop_codon:yes gene_type:complete